MVSSLEFSVFLRQIRLRATTKSGDFFQMTESRFSKYGSTSALGHMGHHGSGRASRRGGHPRAMRDASGQLIIDHDEENLSDKEMYARNVPAIGNKIEIVLGS